MASDSKGPSDYISITILDASGGMKEQKYAGRKDEIMPIYYLQLFPYINDNRYDNETINVDIRSNHRRHVFFSLVKGRKNLDYTITVSVQATSVQLGFDKYDKSWTELSNTSLSFKNLDNKRAKKVLDDICDLVASAIEGVHI